MTTLTDRIAEVLTEALEAGLAHPHQRNFVAIEGELDLDELATYLAHEIVEDLDLTEERGWIRTKGQGECQYAIVGWMPRPSATEGKP